MPARPQSPELMDIKIARLTDPIHHDEEMCLPLITIQDRHDIRVAAFPTVIKGEKDWIARCTGSKYLVDGRRLVGESLLQQAQMPFELLAVEAVSRRTGSSASLGFVPSALDHIMVQKRQGTHGCLWPFGRRDGSPFSPLSVHTCRR